MHNFLSVLSISLILTVGPAQAFAPPSFDASPCTNGNGKTWSMDDLVRMSRSELEILFRSAEQGTTPSGFVSARAIIKPGSRLTVPAAHVTRILWQGKIFQDNGVMVNRVFGVRAIHANIYNSASWLDGRPALFLDYYGTSKLFPNVHDEVREISPGLYLGLTYTKRDPDSAPAVFFVLDARAR